MAWKARLDPLSGAGGCFFENILFLFLRDLPCVAQVKEGKGGGKGKAKAKAKAKAGAGSSASNF